MYEIDLYFHSDEEQLSVMMKMKVVIRNFRTSEGVYSFAQDSSNAKVSSHGLNAMFTK